jgi:hypothetical protein
MPQHGKTWNTPLDSADGVKREFEAEQNPIHWLPVLCP